MKDKPSICTSCSHRKGSIFCALPRNSLEKMERDKLIFRFEPGQLIFSEGHPAFMSSRIM